MDHGCDLLVLALAPHVGGQPVTDQQCREVPRKSVIGQFVLSAHCSSAGSAMCKVGWSTGARTASSPNFNDPTAGFLSIPNSANHGGALSLAGTRDLFLYQC